eukprot:TRINITY_DN2436_c0_g1_i11.p1 TRINITY_DN2436_c0_g1~~TRINITY_DN2436_c0_g1_i11.p1  ORF type:complete len:379 (-),score=33.35 TRINITY_DN2436_c0_g1_i11:704-1840(-)
MLTFYESERGQRLQALLGKPRPNREVPTPAFYNINMSLYLSFVAKTSNKPSVISSNCSGCQSVHNKKLKQRNWQHDIHKPAYRATRFVVKAGPMTESRPLSKHSRYLDLGLKDSASATAFERNVSMVVYLGMCCGRLKILGGEEPSKAIFETCVKACQYMDKDMKSVSSECFEELKSQLSKFKDDPTNVEVYNELQEANSFIQDFVQKGEIGASQSQKTSRYLSEKEIALINSLKVATFLSKMGGQLEAQGYTSEAIWLYENVGQLKRRLLQQKSTSILSSPIHEVVKMLLKKKDDEDDEDVGQVAKCLYAGAIEFWDSELGPNHPDMSTLYVGLAGLILDLGECDNHQYNSQDRVEHLAEYIQQKHRGTGVVPEYII